MNKYLIETADGVCPVWAHTTNEARSIYEGSGVHVRNVKQVETFTPSFDAEYPSLVCGANYGEY